MTDRRPSRASTPHDRWAEQIAALDGAASPSARERKPPITVDRIVTTAFELIEADGYDALTMRRVAAALETGAASLYAHVRGKAELDDLLIGDLAARVDLPSPDPVRWRQQIVDVCRQLRDHYLRFPGVSQAALAASPTSLDTVRLQEGMLGILLAGGVSPQPAAWAIDAAFLYVGAYSLEVSLRHRARRGDRGADDGDARDFDVDEAVARFEMLPPDRFPHTVAYARELTSGAGHERFDFTLDLLFGGLTSTTTRERP